MHVYAYSTRALRSALCAAIGCVALLASRPADAEPSIRIRAGTRIESHVVRDAGGLRLRGEVVDDLGNPLAGRTLAVRIEPQDQASTPARTLSLRTDEAGSFDLAFEPPAGRYRTHLSYEGDAFHDRSERVIEPDHVQARFGSDAPGRLVSSASPALAARSTAAPSMAWLLVPACVSAALAWFALRRSDPRPAVRAPELSPAGVRFGLRTGGLAHAHRLEGRVLDAERLSPLPNASVRLLDQSGRAFPLEVDADGGFRSSSLPAGTYQLVTTAPHYATARAGFTLPHAGQGSGIRVTLLPLRSAVLAEFAPVMAYFVGSERSLRWTTPADALRAGQRVGRATLELEQLTRRIEQAAYGPIPPSEQDLDSIAEAARRTVRGLDAGAGVGPGRGAGAR